MSTNETFIIYKSEFNEIYKFYKENNVRDPIDIIGKNCILYIKKGELKFLLSYNISLKYKGQDYGIDFDVNYAHINDSSIEDDSEPEIYEIIHTISSFGNPEIISSIEKFYDPIFIDWEKVSQSVKQGDTNIDFNYSFKSFILEDCQEEHYRRPYQNTNLPSFSPPRLFPH